GDLIALAASQDVAQRGLARAVGAHDGVHLAGLHVERKALEDVAVADAGVQVFDLEHGIGDSGLGFGKAGSDSGVGEVAVANPQSRIPNPGKVSPASADG